MKIIYKALLLSVFLISCVELTSEPRMIDAKRFLIAYGIKNGVFEGSMNLGPDDYDSIIFTFYIDADWFYKCSPNKRGKDINVLKDEVPATKEGALKVLSLVLLRIAEGHGNKEIFNKAFKYLKEELAKEYTSGYDNCPYTHKPLIITDEEVYAYYSAAIRNKINGISIKHLSKAEQEKARELLHAYCIDPSQTTMDAVKAFKTELEKQSNKKWEAYLNFIKELSAEIHAIVIK